MKGIRFGELHHSPDRLDHPMKRVGDEWREITWDRALAEIGDRVKAIRARHGDDAVAGYLGNPSAFAALHPMAFQAFMMGLGTRNVYTSGSQDLTNKYLVAQRMYGVPLLQPIPDIDRAGMLVLVGTNPAISQMSVVQAPRAMSRLKAVVERGQGGARQPPPHRDGPGRRRAGVHPPGHRRVLPRLVPARAAGHRRPRAPDRRPRPGGRPHRRLRRPRRRGGPLGGGADR